MLEAAAVVGTVELMSRARCAAGFDCLRAMSTLHRPQPEEVDHLLRNAELRDAIEPFLDESIQRLNVAEMPTPLENEFLASMLAWEQAPIVPIAQWFEPELKLTPPDQLDDDMLHAALWNAIDRLYSRRIVLDFTDHLSDRQLYCLIVRDILPCPEKKIDARNGYLHWDCSETGGTPDDWLRYYASDEDRALWLEEAGGDLPPREVPPFPRLMPRDEG
jgi:hypothetical protein